LMSPVVQRAIVKTPSAMELMYSVGFQPMYGHLVLQKIDHPLLARAIRALKEQMETPAFQAAKAAADQRRETSLKEREAAEAVAAQRERFAAQVPKEPRDGEAQSTLICFHFDESGKDKSRTVWRRFESSDTLADLANFARSLPGAPLALTLKNITTHPAAPLDEKRSCRHTLESLDLWPSGHLRICSASAA